MSAHGRRITYRSLNGSARETFRTFPYLLTHTLSFSLLHQGIEPLHATTVVINGRAVALLGDSGYGKSSLGAAFLKAGHTLLTDDLLVIKHTRRCFMAHPGLPQIKLYPHVATLFLGDRITGFPMNPHTTKLMIPLSAHQMTQTPRPLSAIYVLRPPASDTRGKKAAIRPLVQRRAVFELIANTFNLAIKERDRLTRQFDLAIRLAAQLPVKSLSYPRGLTQLPAVVQAIQADLRAEPAS